MLIRPVRRAANERLRKMENVDLNFEYVADVQVMLLEQDNAHGSDSEILDLSDTSDSSDSN